MSNQHDITIQSAGDLKSNNNLRPTPSYLISMWGLDGKQQQFIAIKFDDGHPQYVKCVGLYTKGNKEKIAKDYMAIIKAAPIEDVEELLIPWSRIETVKSLLFKFSGIK
jgi:hypothetical protein